MPPRRSVKRVDIEFMSCEVQSPHIILYMVHSLSRPYRTGFVGYAIEDHTQYPRRPSPATKKARYNGGLTSKARMSDFLDRRNVWMKVASKAL